MPSFIEAPSIPALSVSWNFGISYNKTQGLSHLNILRYGLQTYFLLYLKGMVHLNHFTIPEIFSSYNLSFS